MKEKDTQNVQDDIELTGEDNPIEPELEEIEVAEDKKNKKIREKLKKCEQEKKEHLENLQRMKAEYLNSKKALEENSKREKTRSENKFIQSLLPLADSFHMAMSDKKVWGAVDDNWRKGIESIHAQLHNILESYNVSELNPQEEYFNPELHEAIEIIKVEDPKLDHKVITVIQNGFIRKTDSGEELLRPARVTIGQYAETQEEKGGKDKKEE